MFPNYAVPKTFTLSKILGGLSKTLNVANQVIPLYQQAKPLIGNARSILGVLKEFNTSDEIKKEEIKENKNIEKEETFTISSNDFNNPTFFI